MSESPDIRPDSRPSDPSGEGEKMTHIWEPSVRDGNPVLVCRYPRCEEIWWPDETEPKRNCRG